ncbi:MAG: 16S rRNA (cytidine(1402)-2'-O)-methyltransferase [Woeseiaceae bacterium]
MTEGTLFVVATPIGNLDDLSPRARQVLDAVDLIAAEDTRVTGRLLSHFGINCRQIALHEHNEESVATRIIEDLRNGSSVALVSDAGTPLISDPGFRLLRAAHSAGVRVAPIPGPSAFVSALSASGLPTDRFVFEGFLPAKKAARQKRLKALASETRTAVFYESVHRIEATLADLIDSHGANRQAFIGRELTKMHEQCVAGDLATLAVMLADGRIVRKGEFVLAVAGSGEGSAEKDEVSVERLLAALVDALPGKQAVSIAVAVTGHNKNDLYRRMLALKEPRSDS